MGGGPSVNTAASAESGKPRILVVDDESLIVQSVYWFLAGHGFEVKTTTDPREALVMIGRERFDAVVTDINMQPVSGIDIIRELRRLGVDGKIIVMSAYFKEHEAELRDLNVDAFLEKPFDLNDLLRMMRA
jgi:DNA-binding response OmpR family regulator